MIQPNGATLIHGDCRAVLRTLAAESVHCCITSVPYWGLRSYGTEPQVWGGDREGCTHEWADQERGRRKDVLPSESSAAGRLGTDERQTGSNDGGRFCRHCSAWRGELGLEPSPELYVQHIVAAFREVWRVLRRDGTLWLNMGDCYACSPNGKSAESYRDSDDRRFRDKPFNTASHGRRNTQGGSPIPGVARFSSRGARGGSPKHSSDANFECEGPNRFPQAGLKSKDLVGMPWRVALALQADGWWLRSAITWCKPGPMPESTRDRCTSATEMLFMLARSERYYYDAAAIAEPCVSTHGSGNGFKREARLSFQDDQGARGSEEPWLPGGTRNKRNWWVISTQPFKDAHFATFPEALVAPCILAGTSEAGCCPQCGAPWVRAMKEIGRQKAQNGPGTAKKIEVCQGGHGATSSLYSGTTPTRTTTGWQPTCRHDNPSLVPAVVLDPFAGSGTVGKVATRLGRRSVLIDLNEEYIAMARERTAQQGLML